MRVYVCIDVYFIFDLGPSRDLYMSNRVLIDRCMYTVVIKFEKTKGEKMPR